MLPSNSFASLMLVIWKAFKLTFRPARKHVAKVEDFVLGIGHADGDTVTIPPKKLPNALCDAAEGLQVRLLHGWTRIETTQIRRTLTQRQAVFTHSVRKFIVGLV